MPPVAPTTPCADCRATGQRNDGSQCQTCAGTGKVPGQPRGRSKQLPQFPIGRRMRAPQFSLAPGSGIPAWLSSPSSRVSTQIP